MCRNFFPPGPTQVKWKVLEGHKKCFYIFFIGSFFVCLILGICNIYMKINDVFLTFWRCFLFLSRKNTKPCVWKTRIVKQSLFLQKPFAAFAFEWMSLNACGHISYKVTVKFSGLYLKLSFPWTTEFVGWRANLVSFFNCCRRGPHFNIPALEGLKLDCLLTQTIQPDWAWKDLQRIVVKKIPTQTRCAKVIKSYRRRLEAMIAAIKLEQKF